MTTLDVLRAIAKEELDIDVSAIDPTTPLVSLGVDSLTLVNFIFKVEDHFHVVIEMQQLDSEITLADFAGKVDAELKKKVAVAATTT